MMRSQDSSSHPLLSLADPVACAGRDGLIVVGRVLAGFIFVQGGWGKLMDLPAFQAMLAKAGIPFPELLGSMAAPVEFGAGVCLLLGLATRYAALALLAFTVAASFTSHRFWEFGGDQYRQQGGQFWKNAAMIGGQIALFVTGGGRFSIDRLLRRQP